MTLHRAREYLLSLPRVEETLQWNKLVYWAFDKTVGGKMFAMLDPEPGGSHVGSFAATPQSFESLLELEGVLPAPYLAKAYWVAIEHWQVFNEREWQGHLRAAYERVIGKLPARVQRLAGLTRQEYRSIIRARSAALKTKK